MEINVSLIIYSVCGICLVTGFLCINRNSLFAWNLQNRINLRNGISESFKLGNGIPKSFKKYYSRNLVQLLQKISILKFIYRMAQYNRKEKMDKEIFESISFLRNVAAIGKGKKLNTDSVLQILAEQKGLLQPVYIKMLSLLRLNKINEASAYFSEKVNTAAGKDFARILLQWDRIDPGELSETLLSQEKSMKEIRITAQKRRDEVISDLIYFPVIVNIILIFINFIYVAYFIDQKEMLQMFL